MNCKELPIYSIITFIFELINVPHRHLSLKLSRDASMNRCLNKPLANNIGCVVVVLLPTAAKPPPHSCELPQVVRIQEKSQYEEVLNLFVSSFPSAPL